MFGNINLVDISDQLFNYPVPLFTSKPPIAIFTSGLKPKERLEKFKKEFNRSLYNLSQASGTNDYFQYCLSN